MPGFLSPENIRKDELNGAITIKEAISQLKTLFNYVIGEDGKGIEYDPNDWEKACPNCGNTASAEMGSCQCFIYNWLRNEQRQRMNEVFGLEGSDNAEKGGRWSQ